MKNLARLLAGIIGVGAGPAACTDQKPEKSWLETYAEKFPKDYAEYYLRFFHADSCRPADKAAEELYEVVQSAIRTHTFLGDQGIPKYITRNGWWDMAYVEVARTRSKSNERSTGEGKSISGDGENNSVGYTGNYTDNYAGDDEISLKSLRLERVYPSYLDGHKIVRLVQDFNDEEIAGLGIKTVADLNKLLEHTCRLVSGYDMT